MTYFHYYATTSRNLDRVLQYGIFPVAQVIGFAVTRDSTKARNYARVICAGAYSALTASFFGLESEMIDANSRKAVAAEMGVDPEKVQLSDFKYSKNAIVSRAHRDIMRLQAPRFGTDLMFLLPMIMPGVSAAAEESGKNLLTLGGRREDLWDFSVFAGKAAYWAGETYFVDKTGNYEVVKLRENLQSTGKDLTYNDLLGVYQRTRSDRKLPMIDRKEEYEAIKPILQKIADAYNRHDRKVGMSEIVYLIGLNKVNIHAEDNKTLSLEAIEKSHKEVDKLLALGLDGIREENRSLRKAEGRSTDYDSVAHGKSFVDRLGDRAANVAHSILGKTRNKDHPKRPEEYITQRDPGELTNFNYTVNR